MGLIEVMAENDLWEGEMHAVQIENQSILLVKINDRVYAYEDRCPHQGVPLSQGHLSHSTLTCCAHHWQYELCTGCGINPKSARLKSFQVEIKAGTIFINLSNVNTINNKNQKKPNDVNGEKYDLRK